MAHGKVAIVRVATSSGDEVLAVEISLGDKELTISDQDHTLTPKLREMALALIEQVEQESNKE